MAVERGQVVVAAALPAELAPLQRRLEGRPDIQLVRMGVGPRRAEAAARRTLAGAELVITTGCCGGLVPGAAAGMMVIPSKLLWLNEDGTTEPCPDPDLQWTLRARSQAERMGLHCSDRPLITVAEALNSPHSKRRCHERTGAVAVDMESAAVARVAGELGVPHLCVRVVLDSVDQQLPERTISDGEGQIKPARVVKAMLRPRKFLSMAAMAVRLRSIAEPMAGLVAAVLAD